MRWLLAEPTTLKSTVQTWLVWVHNIISIPGAAAWCLNRKVNSRRGHFGLLGFTVLVLLWLWLTKVVFSEVGIFSKSLSLLLYLSNLILIWLLLSLNRIGENRDIGVIIGARRCWLIGGLRDPICVLRRRGIGDVLCTIWWHL